MVVKVPLAYLPASLLSDQCAKNGQRYTQSPPAMKSVGLKQSCTEYAHFEPNGHDWVMAHFKGTLSEHGIMGASCSFKIHY